eukprot:8341550-Alexandrium_andersonii.AAC.1
MTLPCASGKWNGPRRNVPYSTLDGQGGVFVSPVRLGQLPKDLGCPSALQEREPQQFRGSPR